MVEREMRRQKGFSLIELAIVLVVIGVVTGGIVAAQSMITTAQIQGVVRQVGQFDAAVENFKTKYNYLPGDAPAFGGNGNGLIQGAATGATVGTDVNYDFSYEIAAFWNDIDSQQFPAFPPTGAVAHGVPANISGPNKDVPESKLGVKGSFFIASTVNDPANGYRGDFSNVRNYYAILSPAELQLIASGEYRFQYSNTTNCAIKPVDALALDTKIDDGLAASGNVISGSMSPGLIAQNLFNTTCSTGNNYTLTTTNYACTPIIRIGASVNDPQ